NEPRDLVGRAKALHGDRIAHRLGPRAIDGSYAGLNVAKQLGVDPAGLDIVDGDAARTEIPRETARQAGNRPFGHGIDSATGNRHVVAADAADVDDPPALTHVAHGFLGGDEDTLDVDADHLVEIVERIVGDRSRAHDRGIVD